MSDWLEIVQGPAPLIVSIPHAGTEIPEVYCAGLRSLWLARKDADWWLPQLYGFAEELGATVIRTHMSRTVIDVNRDPSGVSLYPGQAVTEICPTTTFDGEPLYKDGWGVEDVEARRTAYFEPYHAAIEGEIARLRRVHGQVVLYDCHSIRSRIPRLFEGELPHFNIGTNKGASCAPALAARVLEICKAAAGFCHVLNGRFTGGYITRHHGQPERGVHAIQMELACRGYMTEPDVPDEANWPGMYEAEVARPMQESLAEILSVLAKKELLF